MDLSGSRAKVLIVDDSQLIRVAAELILQDEYQVLLVNDGEQGWQKILSDDSIRVVFSDITMPNLDGFSLLKLVRQSDQQRISNLPFIIMTTDADDETRRATALQFGATDFISKPFNSTDLKARAKAHVTSETIARQLKLKAVQLEKNASKDPLTGLNNKSYLLEKLSQDHSYAIRHLTPLTLVRFDIEEFNQVFIQEGKQESNRVIQSIAHIIDKSVREEDTSARVNLSSFIIVMPGSTAKDAEQLLESIQRQVTDLEFSFTNTIIDINLSTVIFSPALNDKLNTDALLNEVDKLAAEVLADHRKKIIIKVDQDENIVRIDKSQECSNLEIEKILSYLKAGESERARALLPALFQALAPLLIGADDARKKELSELLGLK